LGLGVRGYGLGFGVKSIGFKDQGYDLGFMSQILELIV
jgi:tetrahydromethanopterin S-methyltransferase subunit C